VRKVVFRKRWECVESLAPRSKCAVYSGALPWGAERMLFRVLSGLFQFPPEPPPNSKLIPSVICGPL
jgi:hypothetical protein